jgi:hypothetical protein
MTAPTTPGRAPASSGTHVIQGQSVTIPVEIRDASAWTTQFIIPARAARAVLAPVGLEPVEPFPRRAICAFGFVRYVDGDVGPYQEFLLSLMSRRPGVPRSVGAYIHWLPVNQSLTCEAGQSIWGFPKLIADIGITPGRWNTDCELRLDGQLVMEVLVGAGVAVPPSALGAQSIDAYAYRDGVLLRTPWTMDISGVRARPGGQIRWGCGTTAGSPAPVVWRYFRRL